MGHFEISIKLVLLSSSLLILFYPKLTLQQTRGEPVNVGLIVALPWDIANTLRAPLGGPISIALVVVAGAALTLGILLAPVHYILGYPARIYHPARQPGLISDYLYIFKERSFGSGNGTLDGLDDSGRSYGGHTEVDFPSPPDFLSSAFFFIPEEDVECRKMLLCHLHGFLQILPERFTKLIRFFSKRSMSIPGDYKEAVILGLKSQSDCLKTYRCQVELTQIVKDILYDLVSSDLKELWKLQQLF